MNVMGAVAGIETIVPEAGVAVLVLIITENVGEADMMMRGVVEVDLMEGIAGVVFFFFFGHLAAVIISSFLCQCLRLMPWFYAF